MDENTTVSLGKVVITPKGAYSAETQYAILDLVSLNGSSYLARKPSKNVPVTNTEYWMMIAEKGESIADVQWTEEKHLIIVLSSGEEIDIGEIAEALEDAEVATEAANYAATAANSAANAATNAATGAANAAAAANTAAGNATSAASAAGAAATEASEAASTANTAASNANAKASLANEKAALANEKASLANAKAEAAQTAATSANNAAGTANTAADSANSAAEEATTAAESASSAAESAEGAAANANEKAALAQEAAEEADAAREAIQEDLAAKANQTALDAEITRATYAETAQSQQIQELGTSISSEVTRATNAEATKVDKTTQTVVDAAQNDRLKILEAFAEGKLFLTETDAAEAYAKLIKSNVIPEANKALVQSIGGKSRTTKNLAKPYAYNRTDNGITFRTSEDGYIHAEGMATGAAYSILSSAYSAHSYTLQPGTYSFSVKDSVPIGVKVHLLDAANNTLLCEVTDSSLPSPLILTNPTAVIHRISVISGTTVDVDIYAQIEQGSTATPYEPYFEGIISADCDKVVSTGFNLFDGELEEGDYAQGQKHKVNARTRSANPIYIKGISSICFFPDYPRDTWANVQYYDEGMNYIGDDNPYPRRSLIVTPPQNACYMVFFFPYLDLENHVCINASQTDTTKSPHNGQYLPYLHDTMNIPDALREDYPLRSAPNVHDVYDLIAKTHTANVGSRAYQEGDEDDPTVITDSTTTLYPLETPVITDISSYFQADFKPQLAIESGGTVTFEQTDTEFSVPNTISYFRKVVTA